MNITFRQLKLFLAVFDNGSVSAAAKLTHVTQPTASMQLKEISHAVGLPLYDVISKKIHFTDAGKELAKTAREMLHTWNTFEQNMDAAKGLTRGKLKIAVVSTAKYFMPRLIGQFCKKYPDIDVSLEILNRDGVVKRMRENLDDLYIMSQPPSDMDLQDDIFLVNPLVPIAASSHPLTKKNGVLLSALSDQRFILREKGSGTRMAADKYFKSQKFRPDIRMELGSNEAIKEAVAGGLGIGVVSKHALHGHQKEHGVAVINVKGFPITSHWHIVHPAKKQLPTMRVNLPKKLLAFFQTLGRDAF
ncbi:MAG: LysR family transcriptional regulator [Betaproteobacteria bacterium]|nr:LysR family transcriptional regulator [Betaproteobacteria bacterium]